VRKSEHGRAVNDLGDGRLPWPFQQTELNTVD
jgi:hypothetical protein